VQPLYVHQPILQEAPSSKTRVHQGGQPRAAPYYTNNGYGSAGRQRGGSPVRQGENKFASVEAVKRGVAPGYFHDKEAEPDAELPQAVEQYPFNVKDGGPGNNAKDAPQYPPQRKYRDSKPQPYPPQGNYGGPGYQGEPQYPSKGNYGGPDYRDNEPLHPYPSKYGGGPDYKDIPGPDMPKLPMHPRYDEPRGEGPRGIDEVRNNYERFQHEYYSLQRPGEGPRDKHVPYDELLHRYDSLQHEFEAIKQKLGRSDDSQPEDSPKQDMDNGKALDDLKNMYDSMKRMYEDIQKKDIEQQLSEMEQKYEKLLKEDKATDKKTTERTEESEDAEDDDQAADYDGDDNKPKTKDNKYNDDESKSDEEYGDEDGGDEDSKDSKQGRSKAKSNKGLRDKNSKGKDSKEEWFSVFKDGVNKNTPYKKDEDYEGYPDKHHKEHDHPEHRRKDYKGDDGPAWNHQPDNRPPNRDNRPYEGPHGKELPPLEERPYAGPPHDLPPPQEGPYGEGPRDEPPRDYDGEPPRGPKKHRRRPRFNYASMNNTGSYVDPADPYLVADPKCNMDFTPFYDQAEYKFACLSEVFRKTSGSDPYRPTSIQ